MKIVKATVVGVGNLAGNVFILYKELNCSGVRYCHSWMISVADHVLKFPMMQFREIYIYIVKSMQHHYTFVYIGPIWNTILILFNSVNWAILTWFLLLFLDKKDAILANSRESTKLSGQ